MRLELLSTNAYELLSGFKLCNINCVDPILFNCKRDSKNDVINYDSERSNHTLLVEQPSAINTPHGMVWVRGKTFLQGKKESDNLALSSEMPAHRVKVDGFFIDISEVTDLQFKKFVDAQNI